MAERNNPGSRVIYFLYHFTYIIIIYLTFKTICKNCHGKKFPWTGNLTTDRWLSGPLRRPLRYPGSLIPMAIMPRLMALGVRPSRSIKDANVREKGLPRSHSRLIASNLRIAVCVKSIIYSWKQLWYAALNNILPGRNLQSYLAITITLTDDIF